MSSPLPGDNREDSDFEGVDAALQEERTAEFRTLLFEERKRLMKNAQRTLTEEMTVDQDDLPDEMDLATADYSQNLSFRLRGRAPPWARSTALSVSTVRPWWCTGCEAWIGFRRLRARPVTTLYHL